MQSNREVNHPKIPLDRNAKLIPVLNIVSCNLCSNDRGAMVYIYDVDGSDLLLCCDSMGLPKCVTSLPNAKAFRKKWTESLGAHHGLR